MKTLLARAAFLALLAASALLAGLIPATTAAEGFQPCPFPPCAAPCLEPPPHEVVCRGPGGDTIVTSFACCCCGGSSNEYRWID